MLLQQCKICWFVVNTFQMPHCSLSLISVFLLVQPPTVDITPSPATATAGQSYTLTCTVTLTMGVLGQPTIEWMSLDSGDTDIIVGDVTADSGNPSMYTRTLTFMLRTSHGGDYTCQATSSAVTGMDTETLTVQCELNHEVHFTHSTN